MPKASSLKKFLKANDLNEGDIITFNDAGVIREVDFSKARDGSNIKKVLEITAIAPDGSSKVYTPNNTTINMLSEKWGDDTEEWVNRNAKVTFINTIVFGKVQKIMVLEPLD